MVLYEENDPDVIKFRRMTRNLNTGKHRHCPYCHHNFQFDIDAFPKVRDWRVKVIMDHHDDCKYLVLLDRITHFKYKI